MSTGAVCALSFLFGAVITMIVDEAMLRARVRDLERRLDAMEGETR